MADNESPVRVFAVSALIAVVCSLMVTTAVSYFRPLQSAALDQGLARDILIAAGLLDRGESVDAAMLDAHLGDVEMRLVDLAAASFVDDADPRGYDYIAAGERAESSVPIPAARDDAQIGRRPLRMPVYVVRGDGGKIERLVLPVYGKGMWSVIRALVAVGPDMRTIESLVIQGHGETPGVGDRIESPEWLAAWRGRRIAGADGPIALRLGDASRSTGAVDAISGATVTVSSVVSMVNFWLGPDGYGPLLQRLGAATADEGGG